MANSILLMPDGLRPEDLFLFDFQFPGAIASFGDELGAINYADGVMFGLVGKFELGEDDDTLLDISDPVIGGTVTRVTISHQGLWGSDSGIIVRFGSSIDVEYFYERTAQEVLQELLDDGNFINTKTPLPKNDYHLFDGDDVLIHNGTDRIFVFAGNGDDTLETLRAGSDFDGGSGNDTLTGGEGSDRLVGGDGNDTLNGRGKKDILLGGSGDDFLKGGDHDDKLYGNSDDDILIGGLGKDKLFGGSGDDALNGGEDRDRLLGEKGEDWLIGGGGQDTLNGGKGDDLIEGGSGVDFIVGGSGNDVIKDKISGADVASITFFSTINAGSGRDEIKVVSEATNAGASRVLISGGAGKDVIDIKKSGFSDAIVFVFGDSSPGKKSADIVRGFDVDRDRVLIADTFNVLGVTRDSNIEFQDIEFIGSDEFTGVVYQARFESSRLFVDLTGDRNADLEVLLKGVDTLSSANFIDSISDF